MFLLWNQKTNDLETWSAASETRALQSLFKADFIARSNFLPNAFVWDNDETVDFIETIEDCLHRSMGAILLEYLRSHDQNGRLVHNTTRLLNYLQHIPS